MLRLLGLILFLFQNTPRSCGAGACVSLPQRCRQGHSVQNNRQYGTSSKLAPARQRNGKEARRSGQQFHLGWPCMAGGWGPSQRKLWEAQAVCSAILTTSDGEVVISRCSGGGRQYQAEFAPSSAFHIRCSGGGRQYQVEFTPSSAFHMRC